MGFHGRSKQESKQLKMQISIHFCSRSAQYERETIERFLSFMAEGRYELGCVRTEEELGNPVWFQRNIKRAFIFNR